MRKSGQARPRRPAGSESPMQRLFDRHGVRSRAAIVAKWLTHCA
ncbi:hypothetical protein [Streptomyces olindensis]